MMDIGPVHSYNRQMTALERRQDAALRRPWRQALIAGAVTTPDSGTFTITADVTRSVA